MAKALNAAVEGPLADIHIEPRAVSCNRHANIVGRVSIVRLHGFHERYRVAKPGLGEIGHEAAARRDARCADRVTNPIVPNVRYLNGIGRKGPRSLGGCTRDTLGTWTERRFLSGGGMEEVQSGDE